MQKSDSQGGVRGFAGFGPEKNVIASILFRELLWLEERLRDLYPSRFNLTSFCEEKSPLTSSKILAVVTTMPATK